VRRCTTRSRRRTQCSSSRTSTTTTLAVRRRNVKRASCDVQRAACNLQHVEWHGQHTPYDDVQHSEHATSPHAVVRHGTAGRDGEYSLLHAHRRQYRLLLCLFACVEPTARPDRRTDDLRLLCRSLTLKRSTAAAGRHDGRARAFVRPAAPWTCRPVARRDRLCADGARHEEYSDGDVASVHPADTALTHPVCCAAAAHTRSVSLHLRGMDERLSGNPGIPFGARYSPA
jgi:hypothetical protein